ncbi:MULTISPECIES: hypothetical protein [Rhodopirellula]|uniref:hypothetical protein n=1 Tax=Rhodopirellula TaxID=265488 RepID=UPI002580B51B|nr:hypothetical protein [Rhodopirellula sp. UBA1907]
MHNSLCLALALTLLAANARGSDRLKTFLNVSAPQTALNAPAVFTLNGKTVLVGLYFREAGRDVSAMVLDEKQWQPLGENGLAITGVGGNFLSGIATDKDGNPWVLTYYTHPSNPDRADRFFLYTLRDNRWARVGPPNGLKAEYSGDAAIHLRGGTKPVLTYRSYDRTSQSYRHRIFKLQSDAWEETLIDSPIPPGSMITTCDHRGFVVRAEDGQILMTDVADLERNSGAMPRYQIEFPLKHTLDQVYFGPDETLAIVGRDANSRRILFRYSEPKDGTISDRIQLPDESEFIGANWDESGRLFIATNDSETVKVYRWGVSTWTLTSTANEPSGGVLFSPSFTMLENGMPVVTWEAFFPR